MMVGLTDKQQAFVRQYGEHWEDLFKHDFPVPTQYTFSIKEASKPPASPWASFLSDEVITSLEFAESSEANAPSVQVEINRKKQVRDEAKQAYELATALSTTVDGMGLSTISIPTDISEIQHAITTLRSAQEKYVDYYNNNLKFYPGRIIFVNDQYVITPLKKSFLENPEFREVLIEKVSDFLTSQQHAIGDPNKVATDIVDFLLYALRIMQQISTILDENITSGGKPIDDAALSRALSGLTAENKFSKKSEGEDPATKIVAGILKTTKFHLMQRLIEQHKFLRSCENLNTSLRVKNAARGLLITSAEDEKVYTDEENRIKVDTALREVAEAYNRDPKKKQTFLEDIDACSSVKELYDLIIDTCKPQVKAHTSSSLAYLLLTKLFLKLPDLLFENVGTVPQKPDEAVIHLRSKLKITSSAPADISRRDRAATAVTSLRMRARTPSSADTLTALRTANADESPKPPASAAPPPPARTTSPAPSTNSSSS